MRNARIIAILATLLLGIGDAAAHAQLVRASPAVGSIARSAPHEISLWFTENLEPAFSRIEVYGPNGARVDLGKAQVDRASPNRLHVGLRPLAPGTYKVQWRVISVDTHRTEGNFTFEVRP